MTNNVPILRQIAPSAHRLLEYPQRRTIASIVPVLRSKAPSAAIVVNSAVNTLRPSQALAISRVVSLRTLVTTYTSSTPTTVSKGSSGSTSASASERLHTGRDLIRFPNQQQNSKRSLFTDLAVCAAAIVLAKTVYDNWQRLHPDSSLDLINSNGENDNASLNDTLDSVLGAFDPETLAAGAANLVASSPEEVERAKHKLTNMLTPEAVTGILRANEKSVVFAEGLQEPLKGGSIWRYDINSVASNCPIEDDHSEHVVKNSGRDQLLFGVFDGHSGWNCSQKVARELGMYATKSLEKLESTANINTESERITKVSEALQTAFIELDAEIVQHSVERILTNVNSTRTQATQSLLPALAGSCALLAYVDRDDLFVACAGDSRAVMGTWDEKAGKWTAVPMSVDQTGNNEREHERLKKEHPGEEESVIMRGRVLGGL
ncbi:phosphatase 2C-like domain-containing protein, partial [Endogone sp. FLAS-F59071]